MSKEEQQGLPRTNYGDKIPFEPDTVKYLTFMKDIEMSEEEKNAFLQTLFPILWHLVECGFEDKNCEQLICKFAEAVQNPQDGITYKSSINSDLLTSDAKEIWP